MNKSWPVLLLAVSLAMAAPAAHADTVKTGAAAANMARLMGAPAGIDVPNGDEDDTIRLTPDKTKILRLNQDAASVIVTNPANLSVLMDSPRLLIVMPRTPGTTSFTVLNDKGVTIAEKTVIVSGVGTKPKYVRIRRVCDTAGAGCVPTAYYYCPDGCYEVTPVPPDTGAPQVPEVPANAPASLLNTGEQQVTPNAAPPAASETLPPPPAPSTTTQQVPQ